MRAPWSGPARVLDGKATAAAIKAELAGRIAALRERGAAGTTDEELLAALRGRVKALTDAFPLYPGLAQ